MRHKKSNEVYLWDMLDTCEKIQFIVSNKSWHDFEKDLILRHAIERLLEILGKAAEWLKHEPKSDISHRPLSSIPNKKRIQDRRKVNFVL